MSTTLGGTTLPNPKVPGGCVVTLVGEGSIITMANGSTRMQVLNPRYHWALSWTLMSAAERSTLLGKYIVKTSQAFSPPTSASSYNAFVVPGSWHEDQAIDKIGDLRYDISFDVEENE